MTEAEQIMKRCQAGTRNYEEANNLHAACYGIIGKLLVKEKALQALHSENERLGLYKDAYAQPEQEPVKMIAYNCFCGRTMKFESVHGVVAPQRTWVGLTLDEIALLHAN